MGAQFGHHKIMQIVNNIPHVTSFSVYSLLETICHATYLTNLSDFT